MIHIEPNRIDELQPIESGLPSRRWLPFGCLGALVFVLLFVIVFGPGVAILRDFGLAPVEAVPIMMLVATLVSVCTIWRARVLSRKVDERWKQRFEEAASPTRKLARAYGYAPASEGGSDRHRVTISNIDAIWPFDDAALEDLGPGYVLRTVEKEYIFCAGEAFLESEGDGFEDGVFWLSETVTLELGEDLTFVLSAACRGRRLRVADDEVPQDVYPAGCYGPSFAILNDPEIIRRLPPVVDEGPS